MMCKVGVQARNFAIPQPFSIIDKLWRSALHIRTNCTCCTPPFKYHKFYKTDGFSLISAQTVNSPCELMSHRVVENINLYILVEYLGIFNCVWATVPHQRGERGVTITIHFHIRSFYCEQSIFCFSELLGVLVGVVWLLRCHWSLLLRLLKMCAGLLLQQRLSDCKLDTRYCLLQCLLNTSDVDAFPFKMYSKWIGVCNFKPAHY